MYGGSRRASWNQEANGLLASLNISPRSADYTRLCRVLSQLPPSHLLNDLCIPALLSVSAAVSQRVGLEK